MTDGNSQKLEIKELIKTINASPLSDEDKVHWLEILPKLDDSQKKRLHHSIRAKIDVAAAKTAIDKALKIIDQAEAEAEEEIEKEEKTPPSESETKDKVNEELQKEIENPMVPNPEPQSGVTGDQLASSKTEAEEKLKQLRSELSQISQEAHGSTPPSYN